MNALRPSWMSSTAAAVTLWLLSTTALAADTKSAEDWFREGVEHLGSGKLEQATTAFQFCAQFKPDMKECWYNLGVALGRRRDFAGEAKAYEKALELDPKYARAHFNLAVALEDLGRQGDALKHYDAAIAYDPTAQDAWLNRAMLLLSMEKFDEAIAGLEKAVTVAPDNAEGYYDLAEAVQLKAGKLQEPQKSQWLRRAVSHYQQCLQKDPKHHRAWYNVGVVQHRLGDLDPEIASYRKALELKPNYTPALYNLAFALRDKGDRAAAKQAFAAYLLAAGTAPSEARFVEVARREMAKL
jgi:tetratricopeptide (TPR) repeat protein